MKILQDLRCCFNYSIKNYPYILEQNKVRALENFNLRKFGKSASRTSSSGSTRMRSLFFAKSLSRYFNYYISFSLVSMLTLPICAQNYYPVKVEQKWGLMNTQGKLVIPAKYEVISSPQNFGYSLMQSNGKIGIMNPSGSVLLAAKFEEVKILSKNFFLVTQLGVQKIINSKGEKILDYPKNEQVSVINERFLRFSKNGLWGIVNDTGQIIIPPQYEQIELLDNQLFKTTKNHQFGLVNLAGMVILPPSADEINLWNNQLIFFAKGVIWGAINFTGDSVIPPKYSNYKVINPTLIKLERFGESWLFNTQLQQIVTVQSKQDFLPFSSEYVLSKRTNQFGLLDYLGQEILPNQFDEIQSFSATAFRVRNGWKWGIINKNQALVLDYDLDFIAPARKERALIKKGNFFGLIDENGNILIPPEYSKINISGDNIKAFKGEKWTLFYIDDTGIIQQGAQFKKHFKISVQKSNTANPSTILSRNGFGNSYLLENFEWFFDGSQRKWGLRRLSDGQNEIEPTFDRISVQNDLGFTIVGIEKAGQYKFDRTNYRFDFLYGIVNNEVGKLVSHLILWDIRTEDFDNGSLVARVVFNNGRHGLMLRNGKFVKKDFGYIGAFKDGLAKISIGGKISAKLRSKDQSLGLLPNYLNNLMVGSDMIDFTLHDQQFETEAFLTCEDCTWGFIDTTAFITIQPKYEVAHDFINDVCIVKEKGKWNMIDRLGNNLLPQNYDEVSFLNNTDNQIIQLSNHVQKFGLMDTLGQLLVELAYDDIGFFQENRLAVKQNNLWGFLDQNGQEIIPKKFQKIASFSEGFAAVKFQRKWVFINRHGQIVLDDGFKAIGNFKQGRAWVKTQNGVGYISPDGKPLIPYLFDQAFDFNNGIARVVQNGKYGLIDLEGNFIIKPKYTKIEAFDATQLAIVKYGNKVTRYGIINQKGALITKQSYQKIYPYKEGRALVKHKNGYGFIDKNGDLVIAGNYSKAADFSEGRAMVQRDNRCGYIDLAGNEIIPLSYSKCLDFEEGKAVVYYGLKNGGLIDLNGKEIITPNINRLLDFKEGRGLVRKNYQFYYIAEDGSWRDGYFEKARQYQHGIAVVREGGKWGIINKNGINLISNKYDEIEHFKNGLAKVRLTKFMGLANLQGDIIIPPKYEFITYVGDDLFRIENGGKIGYLHKNGNWIWPLRE